MSGTFPGTGLDPGIALQAKAPVSNPLAQVQSVIGAEQGINQLRMFPGQLQQQQIGIQAGQIANARSELQLHQQRLTYFAGLMLPELIGPNGKPTAGIDAKTVAKGLATAVGEGMMSAKDAAGILGTLPNAGSDPVANRQWALQHYAANQAVQGQLGQAITMLGQTPSTIATPAGTYTGGVSGPLSGAPGAFAPQTALPNTVAPAQAAAPETRTLPNGQVVTAPAQTFMPPGAVPPQLGGTGGGVVPLTPEAGAAMGAPAPALPGVPPAPPGAPAVGGAPPPSPTNQPHLGAIPGAPGTLPGAGGAPMEGPSIGTAPAMEASAQHYATASAQADTYQQRVFPLEQAAHALANVNTGPGTQTVNQIKSFLLANVGALPGVNVEKIANYDEAVKYLAQWAANQPAAAGSDFRTQLAQVANASTHISNTAARDVVRNALGLERMQQAAVQSFPGGAQNAGQFDEYMRGFSTSHNPLGFVWNEIPPAEKTAMIKSLTTAQKAQLVNSVHLARHLGLGIGRPAAPAK